MDPVKEEVEETIETEEELRSLGFDMQQQQVTNGQLVSTFTRWR